MHLATLRSHTTRTFNKSTPEGDKLEAGRTLTLLDYQGPGQITRLHLTNKWNDPLFPRKALLNLIAQRRKRTEYYTRSDDVNYMDDCFSSSRSSLIDSSSP